MSELAEISKLKKEIKKLKREIKKFKTPHSISIFEPYGELAELIINPRSYRDDIENLPYKDNFINVKKLEITSGDSYTHLNRFINLKYLYIFGECEYDIVVPDILTNLKVLSINSISHELSAKFTKLKVLRVYRKSIMCIPEEYINLKKVYCGKLFHKVNDNILYENDNKEILKKLYNTLIRMQRKYKLKKFIKTHKTLYNPLYIGGYLGKKRLEKTVDELIS
jgi:hypothetical protein